MLIKEDFEIKNYTSFKIGGKIKKVYFPETIEEFAQILKDEPNIFVGGNWSNTLVSSYGYLGKVFSTAKLDEITISPHPNLTRGCNAHSSQTTTPSPTEKCCRRGDVQIHLSTAYTWDEGKNWALKPLFDDAVEKGILKDTDRNYFQIFTVAGMPNTVAFNCPRILDTQDYTKALQQGRESILRISEFCRIYLPGFENAFISNIADELGVRVSNRIKGKYVYTIDDLRSGKKFENPVVISDYPVDVHSNKKDSSTLEVVQDYQLPVESLMSADIENLFVVGRCLSADFLSQGALRVQPNCFAMGEGVVKFIVKSEK